MDRSRGGAVPLSSDEKYAKLVAAYKKMKEQNTVLKKAVLQGRESMREEKDKVATISDEMKDVETKMRQVAEQNGLLKFHNNSLSKKCEALKRLTEDGSKGATSSGWFGGGAKAELMKKKEELDVTREDLVTKIRENERLHLQLAEQRAENTQTVGVLTGKMKTLKEHLRVQQERLDTESTDFRNTLERATTARDELAVKSNRLQEELQRATLVMKERKDASICMQQSLTRELQAAVGVIERKLPFDDTRYAELNNLNLPGYNVAGQKRKLDVVDESLHFIAQLFANFDEYHKALHERLLIMSKSTTICEQLRVINRKMSSMIPGYSRHLHSVLEALRGLRQSYTSNHERFISNAHCNVAINAVRRWTLFNKKMLSYHLLRLEKECAQEGCTPVLQQHNNMLASTHKQMQSMFNTLATYSTMALLPDANVHPPTRISPYNLLVIHQKLFAAVQGAGEMTQTFATQLNAKIQLEHKFISSFRDHFLTASRQDPFVLPALKTANERLLECWGGVNSFMGRCAKTSSLFLDLVSTAPPFPVRGAPTSTRPGALFHLEDRALQYTERLHGTISSPNIKHISHLQALQNERTIQALRYSERRMKEQMHVLQKQCEQLREDKGKVHSELLTFKDAVAHKQASLNSLRAELVLARQAIKEMTEGKAGVSLPDLSTVIDGAGDDNSEETVVINEAISFLAPEVSPMVSVAIPVLLGDAGDESSSEVAALVTPATSQTALNPESYSMVVMTEDGAESGTFVFSQEDKEREREMRKFYETRLTQLRDQLKKADAKAVEFHAAYNTAEEQLEAALLASEKYRQKHKARKTAMTVAEKDLQFTTTSYEQQIKLLSEHVVSLNDKIVAQEEEINNMKRREAMLMRNTRRK